MRKSAATFILFLVAICISDAERVKKRKNTTKLGPSNFEQFLRSQVRSASSDSIFSSRSASGNHIDMDFGKTSVSKEVTCNLTDNFISNRIDETDLSCSPRKLIRPVTGLVIHHKLMFLNPSHVEVKWCAGSCAADFHNQKTCIADKIKISLIPITAMVGTSPTDTETKCFIAEIQEHESCRCGCPIEEKHCDPKNMRYNKSRCRCECKNSKQQLQCEQQGKIWDPVKCTCRCTHEMPCSTGYLFDPETCSCVKIRDRVNAKQQASWREKLTKSTKKNPKVSTKPPRR